MNNDEKLKEEQLPTQAECDSLLRNEKGSNEDYERVQAVWKEFEMKTFLEYHELYLKGTRPSLNFIFHFFLFLLKAK